MARVVNYLVMVFFVSIIQWSTATKCGLNQITVEQNHTEHCLDCILCPAGMGSTPQCGSFIKTNVTVTCKKCVEGKSYSESHDDTSCMPCQVCVENEEVIKRCTPTSDTQCGKCKPGYYRSYAYSCEECSPCCEATQEHDVEQQCLNQGFPRERACRYTGRDCGATTSTVYAKTTDFVQQLKGNEQDEKRTENNKLSTKTIVGIVIFVLAFLTFLFFAVLITIRLSCKLVLVIQSKRPYVYFYRLEPNNNTVLLTRRNLDANQLELGKTSEGFSKL